MSDTKENRTTGTNSEIRYEFNNLVRIKIGNSIDYDFPWQGSDNPYYISDEEEIEVWREGEKRYIILFDDPEENQTVYNQLLDIRGNSLPYLLDFGELLEERETFDDIDISMELDTIYSEGLDKEHSLNDLTEILNGDTNYYADGIINLVDKLDEEYRFLGS